MSSLLIIPTAMLLAGYLCLSIKVGFIVADLTEDTGFDAGFYMMTVFGMLSAPVAIIATLMEVF